MGHAAELYKPSYLDDYIKIITPGMFSGKEIREIKGQLQKKMLLGEKEFFEQLLKEEVTHYLNRPLYQRIKGKKSPELYRSGYYERELEVKYGSIPDLQVPKLRAGNSEVPRKVFDRYSRYWKGLLDEFLLLYCLGHSLRDIEENLCLLLNNFISLESLNRAILSFSKRVQDFKKEKITDPPPVLIVDGIWVKILHLTGKKKKDKKGRWRWIKVKEKKVILTAMGVWPDGRYEVIYWEIADGEDEESWDRFFSNLYEKGVTEEKVKLVVSDGAGGIESALRLNLPGVLHQRCQFHKIKNIRENLKFEGLELNPSLPLREAIKEAKKKRIRSILRDASYIYKVDEEGEIKRRAKRFREKWEKEEPEAVKNFFTDFEKTLSYLKVDFPIKSLIKTTNLIERYHQEIRRKTREIGCFKSERGCEVVFYLITVRENAKHLSQPP